MFLLYNTLLFLGFALFGGGRYDWAYSWGAVLLGLNALPFLYRLIQKRGHLLGRGPVFWLLGVLLPWCAFGALFYVGLDNPSHELLYPRNLFSPLIPLEFDPPCQAPRMLLAAACSWYSSSGCCACRSTC